jgi:hypothetical protein
MARGLGLSHKCDPGVNGHSIKPGMRVLLLLETGQAPPDLEQDFLVKVLGVVRRPSIYPANPQDSGAICFDQLQKIFFHRRRYIQCIPSIRISRVEQQKYYEIAQFPCCPFASFFLIPS